MGTVTVPGNFKVNAMARRSSSAKNAPMFVPKTPQWQLQSAALIIQKCIRVRLRRKLMDAFDEGRKKLYVQKHAPRAMEGAAILMQAAWRRQNARKMAQDIKDEREVDEYHRSKAGRKQKLFKPRYPPSYYRSAAAFIQNSVGPEKGRVPQHDWQIVRRSLKTARFGHAFANPYKEMPIVFRPVMRPADAQRLHERTLERRRSSSTSVLAVAERPMPAAECPRLSPPAFPA